MSTDLAALAARAVELAAEAGADASAARVVRSRDVEVRWRDGRLEQISEATTRSLSLRLFVDGRYSAVSSSDLRDDALKAFVKDAVALTRALAPDPHRALPDPSLYPAGAAPELGLEDAAYADLSPDERRRTARELSDSAREVPGSEAIVSVTGSVGDRRAELAMATSNGFLGARRETSFWRGADVSVRDADDRRPEDSSFAGSRLLSGLPPASEEGRRAAERALARRGATKAPSGQMTVVVENRAAGRLVSLLLQAMTGAALQQKRSFLDGRMGEAVGSALLDVADNPLLPRGLASRTFDAEGLAARRRAIFENGALRSFYVDTYYGRKLGVPPTTGDTSNLVWRLGEKDLAGLVADAGDGLLVTGFLGGNSNATTGDFSLGVVGHVVRGGAAREAIAEMNVSGNHLELWKRLVAVGNDPYAASALATPSLVFEGVHVAGT